MEALARVKTEIIVPIVELLFILALFYFLWGVVQYILNWNNTTSRQEGQRHMFWGVIGMAIMLSAFGIVSFIFNTVTDNGQNRGVGNQEVQKPDVIQQGRF